MSCNVHKSGKKYSTSFSDERKKSFQQNVLQIRAAYSWSVKNVYKNGPQLLV